MNRALLLIGPTGSGKTPLGNELEARGFFGHRCLHFDFGEQLRRAARGSPSLSAGERERVREVLESGRLLDDGDFPIAEKLLRSFLEERRAAPGDRVVLNGLPRHAGQARDVDRIVTVEMLVELACSPATVLERIRADTGGDREGRDDDAEDEGKTRVTLFEARTAPLVDHYRERGVPVSTVTVRKETTAARAWEALHGPATAAPDRPGHGRHA